MIVILDGQEDLTLMLLQVVFINGIVLPLQPHLQQKAQFVQAIRLLSYIQVSEVPHLRGILVAQPFFPEPQEHPDHLQLRGMLQELMQLLFKLLMPVVALVI